MNVQRVLIAVYLEDYIYCKTKRIDITHLLRNMLHIFVIGSHNEKTEDGLKDLSDIQNEMEVLSIENAKNTNRLMRLREEKDKIELAIAEKLQKQREMEYKFYQQNAGDLL